MNLCFCQECTGPHIFFGLTRWENRMIFRRKNRKCIFSVFEQTAPQPLMATAFIAFTRLGGGREVLDKDVLGWPKTLTLVYVSFASRDKSLWKDFRDLWRPEWISQSGLLCVSVQWPPWLSQELVSAWSISSREATMLLAGRHQSMGNPPYPLVHCYYLMHG